jgi:hypothetical protein
MRSGDFISELEPILRECGLRADAGLIVWLDYTNPAKIGEQLREFEALLDKLREGDIVRVTVNAHPHAFLEEATAAGSPLLAEEKRAKQFQKLKDRLGDLLPSWANAESMTAETLPRVLAEAFAAAALKAFPIGVANLFVPLSLVRYADGQQMLSITGTIVGRSREADMLARLDTKSWPFFSENWTQIHQLVVPILTVRERMFLERGITSKPAAELIEELGFDSASDIKIEEFLDSYKNYYRFYPTLLPADI